MSGSGIRYANADESIVFWNKGNTAAFLAAQVIDNEYAYEYSQWPYMYGGGWYLTEPTIVDYRTGTYSEVSCHLEGFSPAEEAMIFEAVTGKRVLV